MSEFNETNAASDISETNSLLTQEEWAVYSALSQAWNLFAQLPRQHVADTDEFMHAINALKNIVMSRPVSRELIGQGVVGYKSKEFDE